jgi:integrase
VGLLPERAGTDPKTKKRRQFRKVGFTTKRAADAALADLKAKLNMGTYVEPSQETLAQYAPKALARRSITGTGLKATTAATYQRYVEQDIAPSRLGEMKLTDIRRSHVNAWVAELAATRGAVTVRRALATLQMILSAAVREEIIPANPARNIDKPTVPDHPVTAWEPEHVGEFFDRAGRHRLGPLLELAVLTGLRRGEITGLHWSDVDLVGREIVVRHNRVSVDGRVQETTTKTRSGRRTLPRRLSGCLLTWQLRQAEDREAAQEAWQTHGHVFTMEDGRALDPAYVTRLFQKLRRQGEPLPDLDFHGLRHCYASLMIDAGADISIVSKLLGHSSISVTADIYAHMLKAVGQRAVDGVAERIAHTTGCERLKWAWI